MSDEVEIAFGPLERFTERKVKGVILGSAANLTEDSPVDTGHFANNWIASVGEPSRGVSGTREAPSNDAQAAGLVAVAAGYKLPQIGWIANGVPYGRNLNEGHSQQAPAGFVEAGVLRAVREEASKP